MNGQLPAPMRVLAHWAKHVVAETSGQGVVQTLDGVIHEFGDPDNCDICVAILIGMEYPTADELIAAARRVQRVLRDEYRRRGLQL